jgi:hypothetical protein
VTVIDPARDKWVWATALLLLLLMAARAWVVETTAQRPRHAVVRVRLLTGAVAGALAALVGLMAMQGGTLLVRSILDGTDPSAPAAAPPVPAAPADPAAPAAPGPAPAQHPPADPAAPAGG